MLNKKLIFNALVTSFILLLLSMANQYFEEMVWELGDFVIAGILIFGAGLAFIFMVKKINSMVYRVVVGIVIGILFLLIWAELAVGIFGSPFAGS